MLPGTGGQQICKRLVMALFKNMIVHDIHVILEQMVEVSIKRFHRSDLLFGTVILSEERMENGSISGEVFDSILYRNEVKACLFDYMTTHQPRIN